MPGFCLLGYYNPFLLLKNLKMYYIADTEDSL